MNPRSKRWLLALWALTALANAALLFLLIPEFGGRLNPFYGHNVYADGYDQLAASLVAGSGYRFYPDTAPTLMREPGYPLFLAAIFRTFGNNGLAVQAINLCMAVAAAWVVTRIARRVSDDPVMGLGAALLFLFHPGTLIAESRGGVEVLFVLLLTTFLLTVYRALQSHKYTDYLVSGGVLGLTVLVKSTPMLFPPFLLGYLVLFHSRERSRRSHVRNIGLMVAAMFLVLSPWIVRNYGLTGKFVPTASVLGVSAHAGQYICKHLSGGEPWYLLDRQASRERTRLARELGYPFKDVTDGYYQFFYATADEMKFSSLLLNRVIGEYQDSPGLFMKCVGSNMLNIWFAGKTWQSTSMNVAVQLPYLLLSAAGIVLTIRSGGARIIFPLVLLVGYYVAVYVPILAQARYSVSVIPFLSVLASIALVEALRRIGAWVGRKGQV